MASDALKENGLAKTLAKVTFRAGAFNLGACVTGTAAAAFISGSVALAFATGFTFGVLNLYWLLRIANKGIQMGAEKAMRFVSISYYIRFAITALVFGVLITKADMSPWALLAGLAGSITTTLLVMIFVAKEEV